LTRIPLSGTADVTRQIEEPFSFRALSMEFRFLRKKDLLRTALYLILALLILGYFRNTLRKGMSDFKVVHRAAARVLHQENLYNPADGHYVYKYSPSFAVLIAPLALLPLFPAQVLWLMGMCACLFFILKWSKGMILGDKPPPAYLYILTLAATSRFWVREFWLGQTDLLMLLFVFLFILCSNRGQNLRAGLFLALSAAIKPTSLVFVPYLLYKRRFSLIGWSAAAGAALFVLPSLIYGASGDLRLFNDWRAIMSSSSPPLVKAFVNQSLFGMFHRFLAGPSTVGLLSLDAGLVNLLTCACAIGLFLGLILLSRRSKLVENGLARQPETVEYSLLLIFTALFSPLGWFQNFLSSLPAYMLLLYYLFHVRFRDRSLLICLLLSFVLINVFNFEMVGRRTSDLLLALSSVTFGIFLVMAGLFKLRLSRIA
jgi:hypothetical protein